MRFTKKGSMETKSAYYGEQEAGRSTKVRQQLENIAQTINTINFDAAELLVEAQDKGYLDEWGTTLKQFVEDNLDIAEREATYRMRIVRISRQVGYQREEIDQIHISKLKEIFSLNPDGYYFNPQTQGNEKLDGHIHRLVDMARTGAFLESIKTEVKRLKGLSGENDLSWNNYQTTKLTKENVIEPGLEAFRMYLGSKGITEKEGSSEYSDGFVYEMIFAEILSGAPTGEQTFEDEHEEQEAA